MERPRRTRHDKSGVEAFEKNMECAAGKDGGDLMQSTRVYFFNCVH